MTLKREKQEIIDKHLCREITHMRLQCICKSIFFPSNINLSFTCTVKIYYQGKEMEKDKIY